RRSIAVEAGQWLVEQPELGRGPDQPRQSKTPLLPSGEVAAGQACRVRKAEARQRRLDRRARPAHPRPEGEALACRENRLQRIAMADEMQAGAMRPRILPDIAVVP